MGYPWVSQLILINYFFLFFVIIFDCKFDKNFLIFSHGKNLTATQKKSLKSSLRSIKFAEISHCFLHLLHFIKDMCKFPNICICKNALSHTHTHTDSKNSLRTIHVGFPMFFTIGQQQLQQHFKYHHKTNNSNASSKYKIRGILILQQVVLLKQMRLPKRWRYPCDDLEKNYLQFYLLLVLHNSQEFRYGITTKTT